MEKNRIIKSLRLGKKKNKNKNLRSSCTTINPSPPHALNHAPKCHSYMFLEHLPHDLENGRKRCHNGSSLRLKMAHPPPPKKKCQ